MAHDAYIAELNQQRPVPFIDQVRLLKRKESSRYEIVTFDHNFSFAKGFLIVVRALQLLAKNSDGLILVGLAGPSGAGKTVFAEKILNFMPDIAVISMDNYNDTSKIIDGNFDDPRLTDYDTLLKNIYDLKARKWTNVPIYDFKTSSRIGYRKVEVPSSSIVIIEGIYALSEKLRPLLNLRISVTGGIHFDLIKRVLRDVNRAGQHPQEIIHQISRTVYPMYKAYIEPDLRTAHIRIINRFNPLTGSLRPTYILKSQRNRTVEQIKSILSEKHSESMEETYDIYLLPPGEDPETCHSYVRMQNKDGKYNLMFEEWITDPPFIISPRITFEVSVRLLSGLMALGYTIASILRRSSHVFIDESVCVKIDWLKQLNQRYIQVQGQDRFVVRHIAEQLGLEGSYQPHTYIEQVRLQKAADIMALPNDLKTKLHLDKDAVLWPKETLAGAPAMQTRNLNSGMPRHSTIRDENLLKMNRRLEDRTTDSQSALAYQSGLSQLTDTISKLNNQMDDFAFRIEELSANITSAYSSHNAALLTKSCDDAFMGNGSPTGCLLPNSPSSMELAKGSSLTKELSSIMRVQCRVIHRLDELCSLLCKTVGEQSQHNRENGKTSSMGPIAFLAPFVVGVGVWSFFWSRDLYLNR